MADASAVSWRDLFVAGDLSNPEAVVNFRIVQRAGRPFLVLPSDPQAAGRALALYAAQTPRARLAKSLLALAFRLKLPLALPGFTLAIEREEPFAAFLTQCAGGRGFPRFAILTGNPNAEGARFIILVFNERNEPAAVVKAGMGGTAIDLIEDEAYFLASVPPKTPGVPKLRSAFRSPTLHALALDFVPGKSPRPEDEVALEPLLTSWIDSSRVMPIGEMFPWQMLEAGSGVVSPVRASWQSLKDASCHPSLFHGDFTPWNIKVTPGGWVALDWERGELAGVPGWDWFHYFIQSAVLVRREAVPALAARVENLLKSEGFERYTERAKIIGLERKLLLAYLNYAVNVLKQTEELPRMQALLDHLAKAWA